MRWLPCQPSNLATAANQPTMNEVAWHGEVPWECAGCLANQSPWQQPANQQIEKHVTGSH